MFWKNTCVRPHYSRLQTWGQDKPRVACRWEQAGCHLAALLHCAFPPAKGRGQLWGELTKQTLRELACLLSFKEGEPQQECPLGKHRNQRTDNTVPCRWVDRFQSRQSVVLSGGTCRECAQAMTASCAVPKAEAHHSTSLSPMELQASFQGPTDPSSELGSTRSVEIICSLYSTYFS